MERFFCCSELNYAAVKCLEMTVWSSYLKNLKSSLRLDPAVESDVIQELASHLEDKTQEFTELGIPENEAAKAAIRSFGSSRLIARQIYEVHSQGSWRQAFFTALPHFLIALLFTFRCWNNIILLSAIVVTAVGTVIYGWCHGKPLWLFPWLGYCLIPVVFAGVLLIYLPSNWAWFAAITYVPLAAFILISAVKQAARRDWLFASLMLLPIPIVSGWMLALGLKTDFQGYEQLYNTAPWIALSFAVLAIAAVAFIRIRRRWLKAWSLLVLEILVLMLVPLSNENTAPLLWLCLILASLIFLLSPAATRVKKGPIHFSDLLN